MIALTLNQSIPDIEDHLGLTLQSFTYDHSDITDIFIKRMSNLTFRGVSVSKMLSMQWQIQGTGVKQNNFVTKRCAITNLSPFRHISILPFELV